MMVPLHGWRQASLCERQCHPQLELEYTLRIAGEKRDFCGLPEIESFETRKTFTRRPERVVRAEQNATPTLKDPPSSLAQSGTAILRRSHSSTRSGP